VHEGDLSKIRPPCQRKALAGLARELRIGDYCCWQGGDISRGRAKSSLLANALEAIIARIL